MDCLIMVATYGLHKDRLREFESYIGNPNYNPRRVRQNINLIKQLDEVNKHHFTSYEPYHIMHTEMAIDQDIDIFRKIPILIIGLYNFIAAFSILNDYMKIPKSDSGFVFGIGLGFISFGILQSSQILYIPMYRRIKWNLRHRKRKPLKAFHIWAIKKAIPDNGLTDLRKLTHDIGQFINGL
jgi:hypothetical protein